MPSVRWNVAVSADTDKSIRMHLASRGGARKGDISRFIESAVQDAFRGSLLCSTWLLWKHAKLWALQGK